jgi:hypothetical protein
MSGIAVAAVMTPSYPGVDEHADAVLDQGRDVGRVRHHPVRLGGRGWDGDIRIRPPGDLPSEPSINTITGGMTPGCLYLNWTGHSQPN